jgi:hypothetical protein
MSKISHQNCPKKNMYSNLPNITKPKIAQFRWFAIRNYMHRDIRDPSHCGRLMALTMLLWSCTLRWGTVMGPAREASWSAKCGKANEKLSSRDVSTSHSGKIGECFFLKEFIVGFAHENHENASQT